MLFPLILGAAGFAIPRRYHASKARGHRTEEVSMVKYYNHAERNRSLATIGAKVLQRVVLPLKTISINDRCTTIQSFRVRCAGKVVEVPPRARVAKGAGCRSPRLHQVARSFLTRRDFHCLKPPPHSRVLQARPTTRRESG